MKKTFMGMMLISVNKGTEHQKTIKSGSVKLSVEGFVCEKSVEAIHALAVIFLFM
jgi:hypothetical protein